MPSVRQIIDLIEGQVLNEAIVGNPADIEAFIKPYIGQISPEEGKRWFSKKLRSELFNNEKGEWLMSLDGMDPVVLRTSKSFFGRKIEDFATDALERGEPVYAFMPEQARVLNSRLSHLVDWFNALHEVAETEPTNQIETEDKVIAKRELSKLIKLDLAQAEQAADRWFNHMGTRLRGASKSGVEIVLRWPDGTYAVRYTDRETMMRDGKDLQNCLQQGYYWDKVASGDQSVYGIRKANDEAIVGIRVINGNKRSLAECKGKNNRPVDTKYRSYVIAFLDHLGVDSRSNADLKSAGIHVQDGKHGTFEEVAKLIYDQDGVKAWRTDERGEVLIGSKTMTANIQNDHISEIDGELIKGEGADVITPLNALGLPPNHWMIGVLFNLNVVYADGKYGTLSDRATKVGRVGNIKVVSLPGDSVPSTFGNIDLIYFLFDDNNIRVGQIWESGNKIIGFPSNNVLHYANLDDIGLNVFVNVLNLIGKPASLDAAINAMKEGIFTAGTKWATSISDIAQERFTIGDVKVWDAGTRWYAIDKEIKSLIWRKGGAVDFATFVDAVPIVVVDNDLAWAIRRLAEEIKAKKIDNPERVGAVNIKGDVLTDGNKLLDYLTKIEVNNETGIQWDFPKDFEEMISRVAMNFKPRDLARFCSALAVDPQKPFTTKVKGIDNVFGTQVEQVKIVLPDALPTALSIALKMISKKSDKPVTVPASVKKSLLKTIDAAMKYLSQGYRTTGIDYNAVAWDALGLGAEVKALVNASYNRNQEVLRELRDKLNNTKEASLSDRFAALNAARKLKF